MIRAPKLFSKTLDNRAGLCYNNTVSNGLVAQLGERRVRNAEVEGSIPFGSTTSKCVIGTVTHFSFLHGNTQYRGFPCFFASAFSSSHLPRRLSFSYSRPQTQRSAKPCSAQTAEQKRLRGITVTQSLLIIQLLRRRQRHPRAARRVVPQAAPQEQVLRSLPGQRQNSDRR